MKKNEKNKKTLKNYLTNNEKYCIIVGRTKNGSLVKRLRHQPLTLKTWVRFPYESPNRTYPNYFVTDKWFGFVFYY